MKIRTLFILVCIFCCFQTITAQKPNVDDLTAQDSSLILKIKTMQDEQQRIDSVIKTQVQQELAATSNNSKERKVLEEKLHQIELRDSLKQASMMQKVELLKNLTKGFPVNPFGDTLFVIYNSIGSFSPKARAENMTNRIQQLYEEDFFEPDSIGISYNEFGSQLVYKTEYVIMTITESDALRMGKNNKELAVDYVTIIQKAIGKQKEQNSIVNWSKRLGLVALIILCVGLLIYFINRLFRKLSDYLISHKEKYLKGITVKNYKLFSSEESQKVALQILNVIRYLVIIASIYFSLPLLFSVFPETKPFTGTLLGWIITPAKTIVRKVFHYLPNLFTILVIYFFTSYFIKGLKYLTDEVEKGHLVLKGFHKDWAQPTFSIIRFLLFAFMLVIIFPYLPGSGSPAFQGVSVFLGILLSIGSSSAVSNIVAGLVITYMRPFKVGDRIKVGDVVGDVIEKTILVTRLRSIKNEEITLPNSNVLTGYTLNYSKEAKEAGLIMHTTVTIGYDVPWRDMHKALIDAALRTQYILSEPKPFVLQTSLDDFYVSYQINAYTREPNKQVNIYSELHQNIQDSCNEKGIEILSPHYRYMRDGNQTSIPANYLPADYIAPVFKVQHVKED